MINYARHDEEFYGIFKLNNGEEVVGKAILTEDKGETLAFIQDPVTIETFTKELDDGKVARGMGFSHWMTMSEEDFFIIRERDIISLASLSPEYVLMYEAYIAGEEVKAGQPDERKKVAPDEEMGYKGKVDDARKLFEKIYKNPSQP
tara:strand:+ start:112 stop:552 length:441 start_codon:yes stop_codon:yes gene_type:complete